MKKTVRLDTADNVVNAIETLQAGTDYDGITPNQNVPRATKSQSPLSKRANLF